MMEVVSDVLELPVEDAGAVSRFPDVGGLDTEAMGAAAALVERGIVAGEGSGNFNPNGEVNRAAFAKIMIGAQEAAREEGTVPGLEPSGNLEGEGEYPNPQGGEERDENVPTI